MATRSVVVAKLLPSYAALHQLDDDEAKERLDRALAGSLWEGLLDEAWASLLGEAKRLDEAGLLEKVARSLGDRPMRPGKMAPDSPGWSAFWLEVDMAAGTASEMARKALETPAGKQIAAQGRVAAGRFLGAELTR